MVERPVREVLLVGTGVRGVKIEKILQKLRSIMCA